MYDVIVIGGGHAGCEAASAALKVGLNSNLDFKVAVFAINLDSIAMMPCNPNIGGTSKGHLVREIDALGGLMGKNIDKTFIQSKMLNKSKGPAVHSLRAQADKRKYSAEMKSTLEELDNLHIRQSEVIEILVENGKIEGVKTENGTIYKAKAVILCTGTYLNARCLCGETITYCGPNGLKAATSLTDSLKKLGVEMLRFKTGTPARIDGKTIDVSKMQVQNGDEKIVPFSFENMDKQLRTEQALCFLTYTNEKTHEIITNNLHRSPMYSGVIEGTGTRYCPSIEDKVVRFSDKERHQVFIEPEGIGCEIYVSGMSTSLPEDVQLAMYRSVPGLENCEIMRNGYAIEYDCIDATQLTLGLQFKNIKGLFSAGQLNGSSGYEEAAAQGLIAGVNAALYAQNKGQFVLDRSEAYIGVLIDDLVTKGTKEPYRMMTSRSEYRLLLRQDNADLRLTKKGYEVGMIKEERYNKLIEKESLINSEIKRIQKTIITPTEQVNKLLKKYSSSEITTGMKLADLIKRPELSYDALEQIDVARPCNLPEYVKEQVNIQIKYEGYINRQLQEVLQFKKLENKKLPKDADYRQIKGLRLEAQQKLNAICPENIGQASRITGVSPADISVLLVSLNL